MGWAAFARARCEIDGGSSGRGVVWWWWCRRLVIGYILCKKRLSMPGPPSFEPIIVADIAAHLAGGRIQGTVR